MSTIKIHTDYLKVNCLTDNFAYVSKIIAEEVLKKEQERKRLKEEFEKLALMNKYKYGTKDTMIIGDGIEEETSGFIL